MTKEFLNTIDAKIQAKHLLNHNFYQAWNRGELSKECLKEYAMEYYHHVKAFPRYISSLHSRTENAKTRRHLLDNLMEEEAGTPNHPEMWRAFALSLGATDAEIDAHRPSQAIEDVVNTFMDICNHADVASGIASLYAYESQIPSICISKIKGLRQHYGMTNPEDWKYFTVHIEADKEHAAVERALLEEHVNEANKSAVSHNVERTLDALWNFLSSLCDRYQLCSAKM
jgi:pyrroloquinoline-quinone synthase